MFKMCTKCELTKSVEEFNKFCRASDGLQAWCKTCNKENHKDYYLINAEKLINKANKQYANDKAAYRKSHLKRKYNLTQNDYIKMLMQQQGSCALCGTTEPGSGKQNFFIDHDHATGKIRGLLCQNCNMALGFFKDNVNVLFKAIAYLNITTLKEMTEANASF